jgi:hypothetical protein
MPLVCAGERMRDVRQHDMCTCYKEHVILSVAYVLVFVLVDGDDEVDCARAGRTILKVGPKIGRLVQVRTSLEYAKIILPKQPFLSPTFNTVCILVCIQMHVLERQRICCTVKKHACAACISDLMFSVQMKKNVRSIGPWCMNTSAYTRTLNHVPMQYKFSRARHGAHKLVKSYLIEETDPKKCMFNQTLKCYTHV